ncbi:flagellar hook-associated protein FlgK [Burkholderia gladioli]|uniref:flagellar hook-associated protein FlgK n=1 Tax=Burkholderia gladioli TaxID=28095 RepID=UPI00163EEFE4|nr:flagellar hook-associated protein FlgK [Burkholderia gladioli]
MSSNLLNLGLSGINAALWGINTTGQNISNQATPGYSVERPIFAESDGQYTPNGFSPSGVTTVTVQRQFSQYLSDQLNSANTTASALSSYSALVATLNNYVGNPSAGIGAAISSYFSGLQTVANNAGNQSTQQTALSAGQTLATQINAAGAQFDALRTQVNQQLQSSVTSVNALTAQIAQLNQQIATAGSQGQPPNQLLDQRDQAVASLSQYVGVQVTQINGNYNVSIGNGQPLVVGNNSYQLSTAPSAADPSELSLTVQSTVNGAATTTVLPDSSVSGGSIGGALQFRTQTLDPAEAQLGAIAVSFAAQTNAQNALGVDLNGKVGGNLFTLPTPATITNANNTGNATLTAAFDNAQQPPTSDLTLSFNNGTYTLTNKTTGTVVGTANSLPATLGGLKLSATGTMQPGDSFTIEPTRGALNSFGVVSGATIASGAPVFAQKTATNTGTGAITPGSVTTGYQIPSSATTLTYNAASKSLTGFQVGTTVTIGTTPPTTVAITNANTQVPYDASKGATLTITSTVQPPTDTNLMNNVTVSISGAPADGDTFTIQGGSSGTNDGRNAQLLSALATSKAFDGGSTTLTSAYSSYVNNVGNAAASLSARSSVQAGVVSQITTQQQSVSGVNQNEEAVNLMQYQQMYQANAKVIQTASTLFSTLLGIFN